MSVDQPFNIYREQLSSHNHGLALWVPKPVENLHKQPGHVSIGDVGYLDDGAFMRMFNVTLPWDDPSNKLLGEPGKYEPIRPSYSSNVRDDEIREGEYYTVHVSKVDNIGADRHEDSLGQMYQCRAQRCGALLSLPHKGRRRDVIHKKVFENYIRDNVDNWFRWSKEMMLPVEHMEDLILVTGCTLVTSWAAAAFDGQMSVESNAPTISLEVRKSDGGGAQIFWRNIRGNVDFRNSPSVQEPPPQNQCVFIRGFRAKRTLFWTRPMRAAAEPLPDDPDDSREDEIQVIRIPDSPKYRDPLSGILDYIIEKYREDVSTAEDIIAIAHEDNLQFIEGVETLTADAVENFLREKEVPLLIENGAAILRDQAGNDPPVSNEKKTIFYTDPSPSTLPRMFTPSSAVELSPRLPAPLSTEYPILHTPAGNAAPTRPVPYHILDSNQSNQMSSPSVTKTNKYAYRKQAIELVSISRLFLQTQDQTFGSNVNRSLGIVLQSVDDALTSAAEAEKKKSKAADIAFENAVNMLMYYERDNYVHKMVAERMKKVKEEDRSSLKFSNRLKETFLPLEEEPKTEVEFILLKSLSDKNPTVVTQALGKRSNMSEVLWNFSLCKGNARVTLKQNPHFYKDLPEKYEDDFQKDPIEDFLDAFDDFKQDSLDRDRPKPKIFVLTDGKGRIRLVSGQGSRIFGNIWCPQDAIIFKDVCGKLEGEKIVGLSINGRSNLQYCEPSTSNTMERKPLEDWTEPIRTLLRIHPLDRGDSTIYIGMEQSSPHGSRKVLPSISYPRPSGLPSFTIKHKTGPGSTQALLESFQPRPVVTAGISSKHGTAQSPHPPQM